MTAPRCGSNSGGAAGPAPGLGRRARAGGLRDELNAEGMRAGASRAGGAGAARTGAPPRLAFRTRSRELCGGFGRGREQCRRRGLVRERAPERGGGDGVCGAGSPRRVPPSRRSRTAEPAASFLLWAFYRRFSQKGNVAPLGPGRPFPPVAEMLTVSRAGCRGLNARRHDGHHFVRRVVHPEPEKGVPSTATRTLPGSVWRPPLFNTRERHMERVGERVLSVEPRR